MKLRVVHIAWITSCCLLFLIGCTETTTIESAVKDLGSSEFHRMRQAQIHLIAFAKTNPDRVRTAICSQNDPKVWSLGIYVASESAPPLLAELLDDAAEKKVPLGTAVEYLTPKGISTLTPGQRQKIFQQYQTRATAIGSTDQLRKLEKFLNLLSAAGLQSRTNVP